MVRRPLGAETKSVSAHPVPRSAIASVKLGTSVALVCCVEVGVSWSWSWWCGHVKKIKIKMVCACEVP